MQVPLSDPASTISPVPWARCRSLSDAPVPPDPRMPRRPRFSCATQNDRTSSIGFTRLIACRAGQRGCVGIGVGVSSGAPIKTTSGTYGYASERTRRLWTGSESCQALRAVVGNLHAGDLVERPVRLRGVTHQFRGIAIDLVKIRAVRRDPAVGGATGDVSTEPPGGAVSRNLGARRIARDFQAAAVDVIAADVAVAEVCGVYGAVVRRYRQPAQLRGQTRARVDLHERANADLAAFIDSAHGASVADGISVDEGIRPTVQEGDVERRAASGVVEPGCAEGAVLEQRKDGKAIGIWCVRSNRVERAATPLDPQNRRAIRIQTCGNDWLVERGADKDELLIGRDHDHRGHAIGLIVGIHRVPLRSERQLASSVDGHQTQMVGTERVKDDQRAARGAVGERLRGAAPSLHRVSGSFDVDECQSAFFGNGEAGDRVVAAVGREEEATVRRQDDAAGTLEGIRRAVLAADRLEDAGAGATRTDALDLGDHPVRASLIMHDDVLELIRLHVEMPAAHPWLHHLLRHAHVFRHRCFSWLVVCGLWRMYELVCSGDYRDASDLDLRVSDVR